MTEEQMKSFDETINAQTKRFASLFDPACLFEIMTAAYIDGEFVFTVNGYDTDYMSYEGVESLAKDMLFANVIENTNTRTPEYA